MNLLYKQNKAAVPFILNQFDNKAPKPVPIAQIIPFIIDN